MAAVIVGGVAFGYLLWGIPGDDPPTSSGIVGGIGRVVEADLRPAGLLGEQRRVEELVRLDGVAVSDLEVRSLVVDDAGTVWVSVAEHAEHVERAPPVGAQLYAFDGRQWWVLNAPYPVNRVLAGDEESLWVTTFGGAARFDGESWEQYTPDDGVPRSISSASIGPDGELWVYSLGVFEAPTIAMFDGEEWQRWESLTGDFGYGFVATSPDGSVWVASSGARWGEGEPGGIWTLEEGEWVQVWEPTGQHDEFPALAVDADGGLWAAHNNEVLHLFGGETQVYDATDGVGNVSAQIVIPWTPADIEAANNVIWVATLGGGLSRFDVASWQTFNEDHGLPNPRVSEVELGPDGMLWLRVGRDGQQVVVYDANS